MRYVLLTIMYSLVDMQKYASHCTLQTGNPDCAQPWYGEEFLQADRRKSHVQNIDGILDRLGGVMEASWAGKVANMAPTWP